MASVYGKRNYVSAGVSCSTGSYTLVYDGDVDKGENKVVFRATDFGCLMFFGELADAADADAINFNVDDALDLTPVPLGKVYAKGVGGTCVVKKLVA